MLKIAIVDDSATARMMIGKCLDIALSGEVEVIIEAADGQKGIELMKSVLPDLVLTDLNMPNMDGQTFLKKIKSSPRLNYLPVIVITSAGNQKREKELLELGAELVLNKPVTPPMIFGAIKSITENGVLEI